MMRGHLLAIAIFVGTGVASCGPSATPTTAAQVPADAREIKVSLFGVDCADCANDVVLELKKDGPVYDSKFDKKRVVLDLKVAPSIRPEQVIAAAQRAGFRAELGDAGGAYLDEEKTPDGADASTPVADGHDLADLKAILAPGKITIVDFYADWCGPCRDVDKHVKHMLPARADVAYRRLNVVDWDSPLGAHYLKNVPDLPYVLVFDGKGTQVDAISGLDLARLDAALLKAKP
jgi:thiol-disulfide isomerase/thioredoxin